MGLTDEWTIIEPLFVEKRLHSKSSNSWGSAPLLMQPQIRQRHEVTVTCMNLVAERAASKRAALAIIARKQRAPREQPAGQQKIKPAPRLIVLITRRF
jgi:hypothetical protein